MKNILLNNTLQGLNIVNLLPGIEDITFVNIICPGYMRRREGSVEQFDFPMLSDRIDQCPNVRLMIDKMYHYVSKLGDLKNFKIVMILADVAILNYEELAHKQDVKKVLNDFYNDIKKSYIINKSIKVEFVKMSDLAEEFRKIPIDGVKITKTHLDFIDLQDDIEIKAKEYVDSLIFQRVNQAMSDGSFVDKDLDKYITLANKEVARFAVEYGYAGQAIGKLYKNPIVLFTEPSGNLRGYFYHSYLKQDERMPVLYTI